MNNLEKLIETLQNAPIEETACFFDNISCCNLCVNKDMPVSQCISPMCKDKIKQWLESEVEYE